MESVDTGAHRVFEKSLTGCLWLEGSPGLSLSAGLGLEPAFHGAVGVVIGRSSWFLAEGSEGALQSR